VGTLYKTHTQQETAVYLVPVSKWSRPIC